MQRGTNCCALCCVIRCRTEQMRRAFSLSGTGYGVQSSFSSIPDISSVRNLVDFRLNV